MTLAEYFYDACEVTADLGSFKQHLKPRQGGRGEYYRFELDVVLLFGLTELKAQIAWMENVGDSQEVSGHVLTGVCREWKLGVQRVSCMILRRFGRSRYAVQ